ncbi:MAG: hypothetical protein WC334_00330 [Kiritimatiellales bacterium]|jgi:hypothetical protein
MAASFILSSYQAQFGFTIKQTEVAFSFDRFIFPKEPEADGYLRAIEELAEEGDHVVREFGVEVAAEGVGAPEAEVGPEAETGGGFRIATRFLRCHEPQPPVLIIEFYKTT